MSRWLCSDDFVPFDNGGNTDARIVALGSLINANHFAHRADKNFRTASDFGRKGQSDIQLCAGSQILINRKVNATC